MGINFPAAGSLATAALGKVFLEESLAAQCLQQGTGLQGSQTDLALHSLSSSKVL